MRVEILTVDAREMLIEDIFSQFEGASQEVEDEGFILTTDDISEVERECKIFFDSKKQL